MMRVGRTNPPVICGHWEAWVSCVGGLSWEMGTQARWASVVFVCHVFRSQGPSLVPRETEGRRMARWAEGLHSDGDSEQAEQGEAAVGWL